MPYTVQDFLVEQSPIIGTDINQKLMEQPTPWISLYKQEFWDDEKSNTQKTFQFDRAKLVDASNTLADDLVDEVGWANVASTVSFSDNTANHQSDTGDGLPPADTVEFTQTLRSYNLQHKAIWGPPMNTNQLRDKFERVKQMGACVKALADQSREIWIERKRDEYKRIASNLVVLDSSFTLGGTDLYDKLAFPAASSTDQSILTNGFTDSIYEYLNLHGAGMGAMGRAENRPVYGLVTSSRQSRRLIMADPDVREDFRYSSRNESLLGPMGVKWTYNGFTHIIDEKPDRWEFVATGGTPTITLSGSSGNNVNAVITAALSPTINGAVSSSTWPVYKGSQFHINSKTYEVVSRSTALNFVLKTVDGTAAENRTASNAFTAWLKVPQFVTAAVFGVMKRIPNSRWLTGTWEDSYVFHQDVCCSLVPRPITSVGQASFPPVNYSGTFSWKNYDDKTDNPDGTIGQFRGVLSNGTKPENPEFGIVIRHLAVPTPDGRVMNGSSLG